MHPACTKQEGENTYIRTSDATNSELDSEQEMTTEHANTIINRYRYSNPTNTRRVSDLHGEEGRDKETY